MVARNAVQRASISAEYPDTLICINNIVIKWKTFERNTEAAKLMEICVLLREDLDTNHLQFLSSSTAFAAGKTELAGVNVSICRDVASDKLVSGNKNTQMECRAKGVIVDTLQKGHLQGLGHSLVMIELKYIMPSCPTELERYILCVQKARPALQANIKDEPS